MPLRIVVLGNIACEPYPGIAWQAMQYAVGFRQLGHDAYYFETSSSWPYDPIRKSRVNTSGYAVSYLAQVAEMFGFSDRWAYRRSYGDKAWFGLDRESAEELLEHASRVFKVHRSTKTHDTARGACNRLDPIVPRGQQCAEVKWLATDGLSSAHGVLLQGLSAS